MNTAPTPLSTSSPAAPTLDLGTARRRSRRSDSTLTAVIPTVGRITLKRAVRSVLRQSRRTTALVVLDRPEIAASVEKLLDGMPHVLVLTSGGVGGAAARNIGVQAAETTHVAFLDDDDEWVAEKAALQLAAASQDTVLSSRALLIGSTSRVVPEQIYQPGQAGVVDYVLDRSTLRLRRNFMQTSSLLCSRETALQVPWDEQLPRHQDWDWLARMEAAGKTLHMLPDVLVRVQQGSVGSISRTADWRASSRWIDSLETDITAQARADFLTSVVARGAFASGAWMEGTRLLAAGLRTKAHPAAVLVGLSGVMKARGHGR